METILPQSVKACLWSYNTDMFDFSLPNHRNLIIHNVLNYGTSEAVTWLRNTFSKTEITQAIVQSSSSDWSKKSLALWSLIFNVNPSKKGRFV